VVIYYSGTSCCRNMPRGKRKSDSSLPRKSPSPRTMSRRQVEANESDIDSAAGPVQRNVGRSVETIATPPVQRKVGGAEETVGSQSPASNSHSKVVTDNHDQSQQPSI